MATVERRRRRGRRVDQRRLQGNILCGYGNSFGYALFGFVRVEDAAAGREWLGELLPRVTNALPWARADTPWYRIQPGQTIKPDSTLNVAISHAGLRALDLPAEVLASFPEEFQQGMGARAGLLGDVDDSAPGHWDEGLQPGMGHVLVTISAQTPEIRDSRRADLAESVERHAALSLVHEQEAGLLDHPAVGQFGREHFGFADGLSQPAIADPRAGPYTRKGRGTPARLRRWREVAPGEFVLGYADEEGILPPAPLQPFARNASYMVVRKLQQHVARFTSFLLESAGGDPAAAEEIADKMVGRRRNGEPLIPTRGEGPEWLNGFRYSGDKEGLRCPVGSHIRRANPRDALGFHGKLTKRHRIIRRGMPYGTLPEDPAVEDGIDRGLLFVCYQASIERQFELIQRHWLNDGDAFGIGSSTDFLASTAGTPMTIPRAGAPPLILPPQPSFVTTRGGDYFLAPGIEALRALAEGL